LDGEEMERLLRSEKPRAVIDATHPYAVAASENIRRACESAGVRLLRLVRERIEAGDCMIFENMDAIVAWLNGRDGVIFSALGSKDAAALTHVSGFRERVWLRILPDADNLAACIGVGFPAGRIICMQGPFSREMNAAMLRETGADILLTKDSGAEGGFGAKLAAAEDCGVTVAVLARPGRESGVTLTNIMELIENGELL
jgi:precorrin-6x reductase